MPRGISETDVWNACDALLLEGARPTIERVRQKIGSGSPNTVSPFLETWFRHLGGRIKDPGAFSAPPALPDPIQQAAKHFWETALAETRLDFDERLRQGMAAAVANVEAEKARTTQAEAAAFETSSKAARLQAELAERGALLDQERLAGAQAAAYLTDAQRQIEELRSRLAASEASEAKARESSRSDINAAIERLAASERRASLDIDAERTARSRADKRVEALERKLEAMQVDGARQSEAFARLRAEHAGLANQLEQARTREAASTVRAAELTAALAAAQREALAARSQQELVDRLEASLRPASPSTKRRASAKGRAAP